MEAETKERANCVTVTAPTNIAIVKYWGKRCEKLNLPLNSSLSATLHQDHLKTTTRVCTSPSFLEDEVYLNGAKQDVQGNKRLLACFSEIRRIARKQAIGCGKDSPSEISFYSQKVHVQSENNFPTAAGLASSASGYAALVFALANLYGVKGDVTAIARQGSGSACRSLHGGFVQWQMGADEDGSDSIGIHIAPETHWEELRIFVLVVNDMRKKVGSTAGMQSTARTSDLLQHRIKNSVVRNMNTALDAITSKDFSTLADVIMKESNQLHAVCLDTYPPLHYLNDTSYMIINLVHAYNNAVGGIAAAYTFDAGPNACIFTTGDRAGEVAWIISHFFPYCDNSAFFKGIEVVPKQPPDNILSKLDFEINQRGLLKYVICTCLGPGPLVISEGDDNTN